MKESKVIILPVDKVLQSIISNWERDGWELTSIGIFSGMSLGTSRSDDDRIALHFTRKKVEARNKKQAKPQ